MAVFDLDVRGLVETQRKLKLLSDAATSRIAVAALRRAGDAMNTMADRAVRDELNLKRSDTQRVIRLTRPRKGYLAAKVTVSHEPIGLAHYGARQTKRGVTVQVKRRGGRKRVGRAFIIRFASGRQVILQRQGKQRLPVLKLYGPEPFQVIQQKRLQPRILERGHTVFNERFAHEWQRALAQQAGRNNTRP